MIFTFATLNTGQSEFSRSDDVDAQTLSVLRPLIAGKRFDIPGVTDRLVCDVAVDGRNASFAVMDRSGMPVVYGIVCSDDESSGDLWAVIRDMYERVFAGPPKSTKPEVPYLAVMLMPGLAVYPQSARWLGDFERCVAVAVMGNG